MLSPELLDTARTKLLSEKKRISEELSKRGKTIGSGESAEFQTAWEDFGTKEEENAMEVAEYSDSLGVSRALEDELEQIIGALERIEQKTYGICASCRLPIPHQRLMVRPQAHYCIPCQEKLQR